MSAYPSNSGCLSGAVIPPLAVLMVGFLLVILAGFSPIPSSASASIDAVNNPAAAILATAALRPGEAAPVALSYLSNVVAAPEESLQPGDTFTPTPTPAAPIQPVKLTAPRAVILPSALALATPPPLDVPATGLASLFTPEVRFWAREIQAWAAEAGLDPNLLAAVMQIESCGNPLARSSADAMGLFQVMPYHFYERDNPYDPETNALRAMAYLIRSQEAAQGDVRLTLAGYNGGLSVIGIAETEWPEETQRYVYWGSGIYQDAINGANESPRLLEWLASGGDSLCKLARPRLGMGE